MVLSIYFFEQQHYPDLYFLGRIRIVKVMEIIIENEEKYVWSGDLISFKLGTACSDGLELEQLRSYGFISTYITD